MRVSVCFLVVRMILYRSISIIFISYANKTQMKLIIYLKSTVWYAHLLISVLSLVPCWAPSLDVSCGQRQNDCVPRQSIRFPIRLLLLLFFFLQTKATKLLLKTLSLVPDGFFNYQTLLSVSYDTVIN